ncbi:MAG: NADH-quinone oxidoreductase subunit A [Fimbriimonadaceae bacterium]
MSGDYLGILILILVAGIVCAAMVTLSYVLGPKKVTPYKQSPYECGVAPYGDARERFPVKFYLVAILFVLFDIEVVFLWGWMTTFVNAPDIEYQVFSFLVLMVYMALWILGDAYALRIGAVDWDEATSLAPEKLGDPAEDAAPAGIPAGRLQPVGGGR